MRRGLGNLMIKRVLTKERESWWARWLEGRAQTTFSLFGGKKGERGLTNNFLPVGNNFGGN